MQLSFPCYNSAAWSAVASGRGSATTFATKDALQGLGSDNSNIIKGAVVCSADAPWLSWRSKRQLSTHSFEGPLSKFSTGRLGSGPAVERIRKQTSRVVGG